MDEIKKKQKLLVEISDSIHDKEDILSYIAVDLKNYLSDIRLTMDDYNSTAKITILTPLTIDNIYDENIASEDIYL